MFDQIAEAAKDYRVVLEPDENTPEWWAGAPSAVLSPRGEFYLAARMREGRSPRGKRGYEIRILKSDDGRRFTPINRIRREDAGVPGFERPALVVDPVTGLYRLYGCSPLDTGWSIIRFDDAEDPAAFKPSTARPVLQPLPGDPAFARVNGYKDPFIFFHAGRWHMFVIGCDFIERIHYFVSDDGDVWRAATVNPVMENTGWHNFYTRPACVFPMRVGYLLVYEGSCIGWHDPVYNIATGLAYTPDLKAFYDLTPDKPLLKSTTPGDYHTWRYSHWLPVGDQVFMFFEAARPNNTNEVRLATFTPAHAL
ncbi:MAG: hypothetical protein NTZ09_15830 [Candidatus Hydrogenedentes bacterium]|nr:hypothetical protein [Candidatus Hydrogenedentota bacterium]